MCARNRYDALNATTPQFTIAAHPPEYPAYNPSDEFTSSRAGLYHQVGTTRNAQSSPEIWFVILIEEAKLPPRTGHVEHLSSNSMGTRRKKATKGAMALGILWTFGRPVLTSTTWTSWVWFHTSRYFRRRRCRPLVYIIVIFPRLIGLLLPWQVSQVRKLRRH